MCDCLRDLHILRYRYYTFPQHLLCLYDLQLRSGLTTMSYVEIQAFYFSMLPMKIILSSYTSSKLTNLNKPSTAWVYIHVRYNISTKINSTRENLQTKISTCRQTRSVCKSHVEGWCQKNVFHDKGNLRNMKF